MKKRLYRSEHNRKLSGVCGGIAEYFDIDPTIVRLAAVFLCCTFGSCIMFYIKFFRRNFRKEFQMFGFPCLQFFF